MTSKVSSRNAGGFLSMGKRGASLAVLTALLTLAGCASTTKSGTVGITRQQFLLIPAETVEKLSTESYAQQNTQAKKEGKLITSGPQYARLLKISQALRGQVGVFREDTTQWNWQLTLIDAPVINATCAPGGKITFYTGILDKLKLTDDEIAAVMGHEIAHALREHGRERMSQAMASNVALQALAAGTRNGATSAAVASQANKYLFQLPNSRENETEADKIGLELAARAGYNPKAAITLWQKMGAESDGSSPEFLSTHPSNERRIAELSALMPTVMPLYTATKKP
jgi:Zn-dependent protease with chaperone function